MQITARVAFIGIGAVGGAYAMQFQENARDTDVFAITRNAASYRERPMTVNGPAAGPSGLHPAARADGGLHLSVRQVARFPRGDGNRFAPYK